MSWSNRVRGLCAGPRSADSGPGMYSEGRYRGTAFQILLMWMGIIIAGSFWLSVQQSHDVLTLTVLPEVPRESQPILVTLRLNNPAATAQSGVYKLYANGHLVLEGEATVPPQSSRAYQYASRNDLKLGEQVNFVATAKVGGRDVEVVRSLPEYPPQVWSSFVSFASFSTSVMSFMTTMSYYENTFSISTALNTGAIISGVLICLLVFLHLTRPQVLERHLPVVANVRLRFGTLATTLWIIFLGILITRVSMVLA